MFIIHNMVCILTHVSLCCTLLYFSTCSGAMIHFDVRGAMGNVANVDVTVTGGDSKNNPECQGGGSDALTIPYECMATARGGSIGFTCINRPIMFGPGGIPPGVLTVRANLTPGGNINWNAFGKNPGEDDPFPPNAGELVYLCKIFDTRGSIPFGAQIHLDFRSARPFFVQNHMSKIASCFLL